MRRRMLVVGSGLMSALILLATPALAQITTGTVSGTVRDSTGRGDPRRDRRAHQ